MVQSVTGFRESSHAPILETLQQTGTEKRKESVRRKKINVVKESRRWKVKVKTLQEKSYLETNF